ELHAAGRDPEEHHVGGAPVALHDLVGDAGQRPGDVGLTEDRAVCAGRGAGGCGAGCGHAAARTHLATSFSASRDGIKGSLTATTLTRPAGPGRRCPQGVRGALLTPSPAVPVAAVPVAAVPVAAVPVAAVPSRRLSRAAPPRPGPPRRRRARAPCRRCP